MVKTATTEKKPRKEDKKIGESITRIRYDLRGISCAPIKVHYGDDGEETEERG